VCARNAIIKRGVVGIAFLLLVAHALSMHPQANRENARATVLRATDSDERPQVVIGEQRAVTIRDAIEMTSLADPYYLGGKSPANGVAQFSPDGTKFVVLLKKGNLESNMVEYSLDLWRTNEIHHSPKPDVLLVLSSNSNRPAIRCVTWRDEETILFLGEHPGELQQLYRLSIRTRRVERLTNSPTNVIGYDAPGTESIAFLAEELEESGGQKVRRFGLPVTNQLLTEVLLGHPDEYWSDYIRLCVQQQGQPGSAKTLSNRVLLPFPLADARPVVSPNGEYVLLLANVERIPSIWRDYRDPLMQKWTAWKTSPGQYSMLKQYLLFDARTGESNVLLDAPVSIVGGNDSEAAWSPDGQSVVITNTYLPLRGNSAEEREVRSKGAFAVEVRVPSGAITKVSSDDLTLLRWEKDSEQLVLSPQNENVRFEQSRNVRFHRWPRALWKRSEWP
jgi:hypothetical protein